MSGRGSGGVVTGSIRARLMLADQLAQAGDVGQAASVYVQVAKAYADAGRLDEAAAFTDRAHALEPAWFTVGTAGALLESLGSSGGPICTRAAIAHWRAGRVPEALQFYYHATQIDPGDVQALIRLAQAYQHQTMLKEATATFVVASRRLLREKNHREFIAVAEQILRIDGGHAATLRDLARAYLIVGEPRRAVAKLTALMQVVPDDPAGFEILAHAFAVIGKLDVSLSVLNRLVGDLHAQGEMETAGDLLWRALSWRPDDDNYRRHISALLQQAPPEVPEPAEEVEEQIPTKSDMPPSAGLPVATPEPPRAILSAPVPADVYDDEEPDSYNDLAISADDDLAFDPEEPVDPPTRAIPSDVDPPTRAVPPDEFDEPPTSMVTDDDLAEPLTRAIPPEDSESLTTTGPALGDAEGTRMLSLDEIAIVDEASETNIEDAPTIPPGTPKPRKRRPTMPISRGAVPVRTGARQAAPPASQQARDALVQAERSVKRVAKPRKKPARPGRKPILEKHEGTIVLDLRDIMGGAHEDSVSIDVSDIEEVAPEYQLPDLVVDEDSSEILLDPSDLYSQRRAMPRPPTPGQPPGIRSHKPPRAEDSVKVVRPAVLTPMSRAAQGSVDEDEQTRAASIEMLTRTRAEPTPPPGRAPPPPPPPPFGDQTVARPQFTEEDLAEESPTSIMSTNAADVMADLFPTKKKAREKAKPLLKPLEERAPARPATRSAKKKPKVPGKSVQWRKPRAPKRGGPPK